MQNTKSAKLNKIIRPLAMILITALLLVYGTYSWIRRQWTPTIEQSGIEIATGDSLAFMFGEGELEFSRTLNSLLGMDNFVLKSVSNATGESEHFFTLQHSHMGVGHEKYDHITLSDLVNKNPQVGQEYTELGKQYGYAEITFKLYAPSANAQYVYLDPNGSCISNAEPDEPAGEGAPDNDSNINPARSLRVSITWDTGDVDGDGNPVKTTVIFAMDERVDAGLHKAVTQAYKTGTTYYVADGQNRCRYLLDGTLATDSDGNPIEATEFSIGNYTYPAFASAELKKFSAYNGETADKCLFMLNGGESKEVTVRIWLEGTDEHCVDEIAGRQLDLVLSFSGKAVSGEPNNPAQTEVTTTETSAPEQTAPPQN